MEMEGYIFFGHDYILLALFAQKYFARRKHTPLYQKDTKQTQNKPMETTKNLFLLIQFVIFNPTTPFYKNQIV